MKKIFALLLIVLSFGLFSCIIGTSDLEQYIGTYKIGANFKRVYHYYYGKTTTKEDNELISVSFKLEIKDDGKAYVEFSNGDKEVGKVHCNKEKIEFSGISHISSYTFTYKVESSGVILEYSKYETKIGLEYDYHSERLSLRKDAIIPEYDEYQYHTMSANHTCKWIYPKYTNTVVSDNNYRRLKYAEFVVNVGEKTYTIKVDQETQSGTFTIENKKYIFHTDAENPFIPNDMEFTYDDHEEHYIYLSLRYSTTKEMDEYTQEDSYELSFYATR